jgi:uncharacterized membrane protein
VGGGAVAGPRPHPHRSALGLAAFLTVAGAAHFVVPRPYEQIVPQPLGHPRFWVRVSGLAELACAGLVAHPRTRRLGGTLAGGLFVAVFPANVQMALDGGIPGEGFPLGSPVASWLRLPLQVPLVVWARRVAARASD